METQILKIPVNLADEILQLSHPYQMEGLLNAFLHCSTSYLSAFLKKLDPDLKNYQVYINAEKTSNRRWKSIHLCYYIKADIKKDEAWKACRLSIEKYCPLAETIRKTGAKITWEVKLSHT